MFGFWDGVDVQGRRVGGHGEILCSSCEGKGEITDEHAQRIFNGRLRRDDRIARGESIRSEAVRLGITALDLSAIENGRLPSGQKGY